MTSRMFCRIASYYQVMPTYLDFLTTFGQESHRRDHRSNGFRGRTRLSTRPSPETVAVDLGRSGRHIQMCYNLQSVTCSDPPDTPLKDMQWGRGSAALYHHFDVVEGNALWMITTGGRYFRDRVEDTVGLPGRPKDRDYSTLEAAFRSNLEVHAVAAHWAKQGWSAYLRWLEDVIEDSVSFPPYLLCGVSQDMFLWRQDTLKTPRTHYDPDLRHQSMAPQGSSSRRNTSPSTSRPRNITRTAPTKQS